MGIRTPEESLWSDGLEPVPEGLTLTKPEPLYVKLDRPAQGEIEEVKKVDESIAKSEPIKYEDFKRMDLRIGLVLDVSEHPNADKLYVLKVDLGEPQPRQIIAGLRKYYRADEIKGKRIVVVANLEPAKMRGLESQGMLLAGQHDEVVSLLSIDREIPPGSQIH